KAPRSIIIPTGILTIPGSDSVLKLAAWSTDNRHVLLNRSFDDGGEYILLDIENPQESVNVNTALGIAPKMISLRDKRPDQFYYLEDIPGTLRSADLKNRTISAPILEKVIKYETYSDDIILYVTEDKAG